MLFDTISYMNTDIGTIFWKPSSTAGMLRMRAEENAVLCSCFYLGCPEDRLDAGTQHWQERNPHSCCMCTNNCIYTCTFMWSSTMRLQTNRSKCISMQDVKGVCFNHLSLLLYRLNFLKLVKLSSRSYHLLATIPLGNPGWEALFSHWCLNREHPKLTINTCDEYLKNTQ